MKRGSRADERLLSACRKCKGKLSYRSDLEFLLRCQKCYGTWELFICDACETEHSVCKCSVLIFELSNVSRENKVKNTEEIGRKLRGFTQVPTQVTVLAIAVIAFIVGLFCFKHFTGSKVDKNYNMDNLFKKLEKLYPSQRKEIWSHFVSVLENEPPSVKSITFLHGEDETTSECLTNEIVSLFSGNRNLSIEDITFSEVGFKGVDYGFVLEHYLVILKKFRVFVANLTEVSGKFARIFHSLCDEVSSDVKPSLFVFTLKYSNSKTKNLKPLERARAILQETWHDLPDSDFYPLVSRVLKNVVEIVPETSGICLNKQGKNKHGNGRMRSTL